MNRFVRSILNVFRGGLRAFLRYPASMFCAVVIAVTASIRLALDGDADFEALLIRIQWPRCSAGHSV